MQHLPLSRDPRARWATRHGDRAVGATPVLTIENAAEPVADVAVTVKTKHGVSLGQFGSEVAPVSLRETSHSDHCLGPAALTLEIGLRQDRVDRVFLGRIHKTTGIDDNNIRIRGIVAQHKAISG